MCGKSHNRVSNVTFKISQQKIVFFLNKLKSFLCKIDALENQIAYQNQKS